MEGEQLPDTSFSVPKEAPKRFGFDHCRICGKALPMSNMQFLSNWEDAQRHQLIPEAEWRRRGFLAAPTWMQLNDNPAEGCCIDCGMSVLRSPNKGIVRLMFLVVLLIVLFGASLFIKTSFR